MKKFWVLFFTFFSIIFADDYQKFPIDEEKTLYKTPWGDENIQNILKMEKK